MKTHRALEIALYLAMAIFFTSCATSIDWDSRIGTYTFDQAVMEFGPPHRQTMLSDGRVVAEWITVYLRPGSTTVVGGGIYGFRSGGAATVIHNPPTYRQRTLRLTFSTNHVLTAWTRN
jgi:hypothetical protein